MCFQSCLHLCGRHRKFKKMFSLTLQSLTYINKWLKEKDNRSYKDPNNSHQNYFYTNMHNIYMFINLTEHFI